MKNWNKGRFGFWFYTKNNMRNRDAVMARIMETQGGYKERKRILALIANYWCGEENCRKHGTDWEAFIKEIENDNE